MCVIKFSLPKYEIYAMYFKFGRLLVILLNIALLLIIFLILSEFHGVVIFRDGGYTDWTSFTECTVSCGGLFYQSVWMSGRKIYLTGYCSAVTKGQSLGKELNNQVKQLSAGYVRTIETTGHADTLFLLFLFTFLHIR